VDAFDNVIPPMLYLPVSDHPDGGHTAIVRELSDGRSGLLAYTALDRLVRRCGPNQPWMLLATADLGSVKQSTPFDVITFDLDIPSALLADGRLR
jgi:hypothetical protein